MELVFGIVLGLFVLVVLIVLHELGHAIVARRNGVVVEEFGIGFPPRAWKKKLKNGVLFSLNWLPLGGFVKLKGEHDSARGKGTYGQASFWVKTKILLAGVAVNWLTAALLLGVLSLWGLPKLFEHQVVLPFDNTVTHSPLEVYAVSKGSPAEDAGVRAGDEIVAINDERIVTSRELSDATERYAGQEVVLQYHRADEIRDTVVELRDTVEGGQGYLGVTSTQSSTVRATWSAPILGIATAGQMTYEVVAGLGDTLAKLVTGFFGQFVGSDESRDAARQNLQAVGESVAGPIGILAVLFPSVLETGVTQVLLLAAVISLTLAVMNVLPIPALDGGRWVTMALFRLFRKELTKEREENIQAIGFLVLMVLVILVTWSDVGKLF